MVEIAFAALHEVEKRQYPPEPQQRISEDREEIEPRLVVDFIPQEAVWMSWCVLPEQTPVHKYIPCQAVTRIDNFTAKVNPEGNIDSLLDQVVCAVAFHEPNGSEGHDQARRVLSCID